MSKRNHSVPFIWDEQTGRYRHGRSGRFVSRGQARALYDRYTDGVSAAMADATARLAEGRLSLADWERTMRRQIRDAHATAYAMARGGWARMTPSDWGRVGAAVREQYRFLSAFAEGIRSGAVPLKRALVPRARMYAEAARRTHFETERVLMAARGYVEERSVLDIADHCDGCLTEAGKGWRPIGTLLPIGARDCLSRCRCRFEYRRRDMLGQASGDGDVEIRQRPDLEKLSQAEFEAAIRNSEVEVLGAFRDGKQIMVPVQGSRNQVQLHPDVNASRAIVIHNHPDDLLPSPPDLVNAKRRRIAALRIPTPNRTFSVRPDVDWPDEGFLTEALERAHQTAHDQTALEAARASEPVGDDWARRRYRRRYLVRMIRELRHIGVIMTVED